MKQPGFTLIELTITLMITSMMVVMLYQVYAQSNDVIRRIRSFLLYTETLPLAYRQLEADIAGSFVPQQGYPETTEQMVTGTPVGQPQKSQEKQQEKPAKIQEVFYTQYEKDNLVLLSFITTNPMIAYGEITPRVVRVTYRLDKIADSDLFKLMRSESSDLVFDKEKIKKDGAEIMTDIRKLSGKFFALPQESKEKEKKAETKEYRSFNRWSKEEQKKTKRIIPDFVEISGSLVIDTRLERERAFRWEYSIAAQEGKVLQQAPQLPVNQPAALPARQPQ